MKTLISFSGGKDSTALLLYAKEQGILDNADVVYCDTGWENPVTYDYIQYVGKAVNKEIVILKPEYSFLELAKKKKRFPSSQARFCTEELKLKPMKNTLHSIYLNVRYLLVFEQRNHSAGQNYLKEPLPIITVAIWLDLF